MSEAGGDEERRAVTISVELEHDGSGRAWCSLCGELEASPGGRGDVGALVRGKAAAHASLHSTALANGIPWPVVQAALDGRRPPPRMHHRPT